MAFKNPKTNICLINSKFIFIGFLNFFFQISFKFQIRIFNFRLLKMKNPRNSMNSLKTPKPNNFLNFLLPIEKDQLSLEKAFFPSENMSFSSKPSNSNTQKRDYNALIANIPFLKPKSKRKSPISLEKTRKLSNSLKKPEETFIDKRKIADFHIIGTAFNKIVLLFDPFGLNLVALDQHAIHERVCYEILCEKLDQEILGKEGFEGFDAGLLYLSEKKKEKIMVFNNLYEKFIINPEENSFSFEKIENLVDFQRFQKEFRLWGFDYEIDFASISLKEIKVPMVLNEKVAFKDNYKDFLDYFQRKALKSYRYPAIIDKILMSKSCKNAIKFNEKLSKRKIETLKKNLSKCRFPFVCVHGRNSMFPILTLR